MQLVLNVDPAFPPRARAWLGELPRPRAESPRIVQKGRRGVHHRPPRSNATMAAVEVFIPRGARFIYGLLAGEFVPSDSEELVVEVASAQTGDTITDWSLARGLDTVKAGIPTWAVEDILNSALEAAETQAIGPGCLRFPSGAYGAIGSSAWVFQGLTKIVVTLLSGDDRSLSAEELSSLLRLHLS